MKWLKWLAIAVVTVGILALIAEFVLRLVIPNQVASLVRTELQMKDDHPVEVDLGGSTLLNSLKGGIGDISIRIPDVNIEGIMLDGSGSADFVPFNTEQGEIQGATASLVADSDQLDALIALVTQGFADTGRVEDGDIVVGKALEFFGQEVEATATFGLQIEGGDLVIEPKSLEAAGFNLDIDRLSGFAPSLVEPLAGSHTVCVRDQLPAGITLTRLTLADDGSVRIDAAVDPAIVSDEQQLAMGTCE